MNQFGSWDKALNAVMEVWKARVSPAIASGQLTDKQLGEISGLFYAIQALRKGKELEIAEFEEAHEEAHRENLSAPPLTWDDI